MVLGHVAAEDLHGGYAQAQGEEGLVHGGGGHVAQAHLGGSLKVRQQVELHALDSAVQADAVDGQHHYEQQQGGHHPLAYPLQALLYAEAAHQKACQHGEGHPNAHLHRVGEHGGEDPVHGGDLHAAEGAAGELEEVAQHPAGHGGVVHHQQVAAYDAHPAVDVPLAAGLFQGLVAQHGAFSAGSAYSQFHGEHRHAHDDEEQQVEEHEYAAAVDAGDVGEAPHVAYADGAAGAHQQKAQA